MIGQIIVFLMFISVPLGGLIFSIKVKKNTEKLLKK